MPPKTIAEVNEMVADLRREHEVLESKVEGIDERIRDAELFRLRERLTAIETLLAELQKRFEEADRRRWQLWLGIGVCTLTFATNRTVQLLVLLAKR